MPLRASRRLQSKETTQNVATKYATDHENADSQPRPPEATGRRKRVVLNRSKTVADRLETDEDDVRVGAKRKAVEAEALADLTLPPSSPPPAKKPRGNHSRWSEWSNGESLVVIIDDKSVAEKMSAAQAARAPVGRTSKRRKNGNGTNEEASAVNGGTSAARKLAGRREASSGGDSVVVRRNSLQRPTPHVPPRPSQHVEVESYDVPVDDEEEENAATVRGDDEFSLVRSKQNRRRPALRQNNDDGQRNSSKVPERHSQVVDQEQSQALEDVPDQEPAVKHTHNSQNHELQGREAVELPFGPVNLQEHHLAKVYCGPVQKAFLQMGKECWAGGGDGWHSDWELNTNFDSTDELAIAFKKMYSQLREAPSHPDVTEQDEYLRLNAARIGRRISAVNALVADFCSSPPPKKRARALAEDVTKAIVPAAVVLLRHIFIICGMSTESVLSTRRCAYMSPTTVALANHAIEWLKDLTGTVVRRVEPAPGAGSLKGLHTQVQREVLIDTLDQLQKGKGGLAESGATFEEIAEEERVEQECREAEAVVRREATINDAAIRRNREAEARAKYATDDDQYMAFCRSTQNLGPDPLWEHRRRKMQASMNAFAAAATVVSGPARPASVMVKASPQQPVKPVKQQPRAHVLDDQGEPSEEEKKLILEHVVTNPRFDANAVAHELGWAPGRVDKWRDILVDRARKAYQARGYPVSKLPKWLFH